MSYSKGQDSYKTHSGSTTLTRYPVSTRVCCRLPCTRSITRSKTCNRSRQRTRLAMGERPRPLRPSGARRAHGWAVASLTLDRASLRARLSLHKAIQRAMSHALCMANNTRPLLARLSALTLSLFPYPAQRLPLLVAPPRQARTQRSAAVGSPRLQHAALGNLALDLPVSIPVDGAGRSEPRQE